LAIMEAVRNVLPEFEANTIKIVLLFIRTK
jgi:hypothetical protein